jgi:hypothetical protein
LGIRLAAKADQSEDGALRAACLFPGRFPPQYLLHSFGVFEALSPKRLELPQEPLSIYSALVPKANKTQDACRVRSEALGGEVATDIKVGCLPQARQFSHLGACRQSMRHGAEPSAARPGMVGDFAAAQIVNQNHQVEVLKMAEDLMDDRGDWHGD